MSWAVFLDRDGVLTEAPVVDGKALSPSQAKDLVLLPGAEEAVAKLRALGALTFVVTNQPDVARGALNPTQLELMHDHLARVLRVDEIRACPHDSTDACLCRKPRAGMLTELASGWNVDLESSYMVGDRWVDIAAGCAAGVTTILVERSYSWSPTSAGVPPPDLEPDHRVRDVMAAAEVIATHASDDHRTRHRVVADEVPERGYEA
jgi:D-glycero-D-manno-heptose 1,7-bisphosphate phosphatase